MELERCAEQLKELLKLFGKIAEKHGLLGVLSYPGGDTRCTSYQCVRACVCACVRVCAHACVHHGPSGIVTMVCSFSLRRCNYP